MRAIGNLSTELDARRLSGYLLTLGITTHIDPGANGYCVWIREEDKLERARQEFAAYLANPNNPLYDEAHAAAEKIRTETLKAEKAYRRNLRDMRARWRRPNLQGCPLTISLIAACIMVAIGSKLGTQPEPLLNYLRITRVTPERMPPWDSSLPEVRHGQIWRLITPIFIHFGWMHLLFNMWNMYFISGAIETTRGRWRLLLLILATALISNAAQFLYSTGDPRFGGMSGVLYGLFGYAWMKSRFDSTIGLYLNPDTVMLMIAWLFICMTGHVGPIANAAHVGGLVAGVVIGVAPIVWRRIRKL